MAEKRAVREDGKGEVQLSASSFTPQHSGKLSTPTKNKDGDQTPNSVKSDHLKNMDELIQRLSKSARQGVYGSSARKPAPTMCCPDNVAQGTLCLLYGT